MGIHLQTLVDQLDALCQAIDVLTTAAEQLFVSQPSATVITSMPDAGPITGARLLAEIGDDPNRLPDQPRDGQLRPIIDPFSIPGLAIIGLDVADEIRFPPWKFRDALPEIRPGHVAASRSGAMPPIGPGVRGPAS